MCQSLTAGFQASLSFIFYKMGDGYSTYQRVKLMVNHWLLSGHGVYLRQNTFEGWQGRESLISQGVMMGFSVHYGGLDGGVS